ncbi:M56 family metallopeptidase [Brevundimonas pondensis]|uniref:M56 family metallopeptidase n=1 Tax=Brevundimonas pondensis TaxID=2774189 RepID=A0ABX7SLJ6_9CAUL|nr:M56 family metallopeptidase [Brevundimonas pondensis]QTC88363.1 M56 family metallopeptidase [Brevundimonas pondensis]
MTWQLILELLLKSGVVACVGLGLSALSASRPAAERAAILRVTVCILLVLPVFLWIGPRLELALLAAPAATETRTWSLDLQPLAGIAVSGEGPASLPWTVIAALIYASGLVFIAGRFLLGVWTLRRWSETGRPVSHRVWTETLARLEAPQGARLIATPHVRAPLSWGLPPGTILVGEDCVRRAETAEAVLAHELAHIRRGDWIFALLSRLALALFWFNPLVWLLHAHLAARTEEAADALAVDRMDHRTYARVLVDLASNLANPSATGRAALGMTGSHASLAKRISRIMKVRPKASPRPIALLLSAGGLLAIATPLAAIELTPRIDATAWLAPPAPPPAPPAPPAPSAVLAPRLRPRPGAPAPRRSSFRREATSIWVRSPRMNGARSGPPPMRPGTPPRRRAGKPSRRAGRPTWNVAPRSTPPARAAPPPSMPREKSPSQRERPPCTPERPPLPPVRKFASP